MVISEIPINAYFMRYDNRRKDSVFFRYMQTFWIVFRKFGRFFGLEYYTGVGNTRYTCGRNRKTKRMADRQEIPEWYSGKGKKGYDAECNSLSNECLNTSIYTSKKNDNIKTHSEYYKNE